MSDLPVIAIVGGTGAEGAGLAVRWARAGYRVILGSRSAVRAASSAAGLAEHGRVEGAANADAAAAADIVAVTVPFAAQRQTMADIAEAARGKIVIDVTVPLVPPRVARVQLPEEGSAAAIAQQILGPETRVVSAFQNVAADHLADPAHEMDCDVLVCGDSKEARAEAMKLIEAAGLRGIEAGPLDNAVAAEALTSVLIWINRRYESPGSGIRITGLPGDSAGDSG